MKKITEIQITPIKPKNGLVAFASFVLFESVYCSSIGIITRPQGGYRLLFPTKKVGDRNISIFNPINCDFGDHVTKEVIKTYEEVTNSDRYRGTHNP